MKNILHLAIVFALTTSCHKEDNIQQQNTSTICFKANFINTNTADNFQSIFFINGRDGFVGGYDGGIYKTIDSATSWTKLVTPVSLPVFGIYFIDSNTGFAVGGEASCGGSGCTPPGGFILRTQDAGNTWVKVFTPSTKTEITSICFINSTTGFCIGGNALLKTVDGGQSWTENELDIIPGKLMGISFVDSKTGFITCLDKILKTSNAGASWEVSNPDSRGLYSLTSSNGVIYVSGQRKMQKSIDGGKSWKELANSPTRINAIRFINKNTGYAFGIGNYSGGDFGRSYGGMYCTTNGGESWNGNGDFEEVGLIAAVSFPTADIGYAISGNRVIKISIK